MGLIFIRLVVLFASLTFVYLVWDKVIHPLLFKEKIETKLESAVETKVLMETDKKVEEILSKDLKE